MFESFPKQRRPLPEKYQEIYSVHYKKNREGKTTASSLSQKMESWLHKKVAADLGENTSKSTLEIGAGTLNQLYFENTRPYDIVEPFVTLFEGSENLKKVRNIYHDITEVPTNLSYDRITSIATFEHIANLPKVVAKTCLMLADGGSLRVSIPNEGKLLWKLGWFFTTGLEFRIKYNLNYGVLMRHEHLNKADEIEQILNYFYSNIKCSYFGLNRNLALYRFYECRGPYFDKANDFV